MAPMNKAARASLAKETINMQIPLVLASNARARSGVQNTRRFLGGADLPKLPTSPCRDSCQERPNLTVTMRQMDTLEAARLLRQSHPDARIAVLNMASPLQPGGGVLRGARAQEESLCMRTTLYPSLKPEWYRHKADTVIYTPDVLVFKSAAPQMDLLNAKEQFYVDVISCAAPRYPEVTQPKNGDSGGPKYADPRDEEWMALKIKYIMRTAVQMGITHLVLGAIGCGAYRNPIKQAAAMMRRCLLGRGHGRLPEEDWATAGVSQVVFAILDDSPKQAVWNGFVEAFQGDDGVSFDETT